MCKYCERQKKDSEDLHPQVDLLMDSQDVMACIGEISPIAERKYPGYTGELHVYYDHSTVSIPIKYCPICGRKLE